MGEHLAQQVRLDEWGELRVRGCQGVGSGQQDVLLPARQHPVDRPGRPGPVVVYVQRRAVVDEPEPPAPDEQVRVPPRPVHVQGQRVQPEHSGGEGRVDLEGEWIVGDGTGQVVHAEVAARAGSQQLLDLLIRLGPAKLRVEVDHDQFGHGQPQRPGEFAHYDLGDERLGTLARSPELHHPRAEVVALHEAGQAAALPQRGGVAGRRHGTQHTDQCGRWCSCPRQGAGWA